MAFIYGLAIGLCYLYHPVSSYSPKGLGHLGITQKITLDDYIDCIILIGQDKQEVVSTLP